MYKDIVSEDRKYSYRIFDNGEIYNLTKNKYVNQHKINNGYLQVSLHLFNRSYSYLVHRIILSVFTNKPIDYNMQVNHKDGNKANNKLSNLEWGTQSENLKHAFKNNLVSQTGSKNSCAILDEDKVVQICELIEKNTPITNIAIMFNVSKWTIDNIYQGISWTHVTCNYKFKYRRHLTPDIVIKICDDIMDGLTYEDLINKYNVSLHILRSIRSKKCWKDITKQYNFPVVYMNNKSRKKFND